MGKLVLSKIRGCIILEYYNIFVILTKYQRKVKYTYLHTSNVYCDDN